MRTAQAKSEQAKAAATGRLMAIYRGKADIHKAAFENDSAAYYLKKMVELDTTNVDNALETGNFLCKYLAKY